MKLPLTKSKQESTKQTKLRLEILPLDHQVGHTELSNPAGNTSKNAYSRKV
jgi:hypothetical protein